MSGDKGGSARQWPRVSAFVYNRAVGARSIERDKQDKRLGQSQLPSESRFSPDLEFRPIQKTCSNS
jgi:hypothetical protein